MLPFLLGDAPPFFRPAPTDGALQSSGFGNMATCSTTSVPIVRRSPFLFVSTIPPSCAVSSNLLRGTVAETSADDRLTSPSSSSLPSFDHGRGTAGPSASSASSSLLPSDDSPSSIASASTAVAPPPMSWADISSAFGRDAVHSSRKEAVPMASSSNRLFRRNVASSDAEQFKGSSAFALSYILASLADGSTSSIFRWFTNAQRKAEDVATTTLPTTQL
mmetsp:Transcript_50366/g.151699  ORF Transcript_50366/g.151699 Transcript_50366/m.151699 type:complete len:219 (+) Transcript_50366:1527-2183(+)